MTDNRKRVAVKTKGPSMDGPGVVAVKQLRESPLIRSV